MDEKTRTEGIQDALTKTLELVQKLETNMTEAKMDDVRNEILIQLIKIDKYVQSYWKYN